MKRDMNLIRNIMLHVRNGNDDFVSVGRHIFEEVGLSITEDTIGESWGKFNYHVSLIKDAGFFYCIGAVAVNRGQLVELTWAGHEFIENIADDTAWDVVSDWATEHGVSVTQLLIEEYFDIPRYGR